MTVFEPTVLVRTTARHLHQRITYSEIDLALMSENNHEICIKMMSGDAFYEYVTNNVCV